MKKTICILAFSCLTFILNAQQRINGDFAFQTDPAKKYSIYVPSNYDATTPNKLMLGLHPLNPNNWDGSIWCDTLVVFAEANQLLLVCPDGGTDGAIDDPIDLAFTTALLDSMELWYNVDTSKMYAMGFSWGGKTTYTYGLNNIPRLKGFIPIGAAINGVSEVNGIIQNAASRPFYLVHGGNDSPNSRFYPLLEALEDNDAFVNSNLLPGVGHTINFPNRNQILIDAFHWVDSVHCASINTTSINDQLYANATFSVAPNPLFLNQTFLLNIDQLENDVELDFAIYDQSGKMISTWTEQLGAGQEQLKVTQSFAVAGVYYLRLSRNGELIRNLKIVVQ